MILGSLSVWFGRSSVLRFWEFAFYLDDLARSCSASRSLRSPLHFLLHFEAQLSLVSSIQISYRVVCRGKLARTHCSRRSSSDSRCRDWMASRHLILLAPL